MKHLIGAVLCGALLAACASPSTKGFNIDSQSAAIEAEKQRRIVAEARLANDRRVLTIANRIRRNGAELCGEKIAADMDFEFANLPAVAKDWRDAYTAVYGLDELNRLTVYFTGEDGPAARAGIRPGDVLLAVDGQEFKRGKKAHKDATKKLRRAMEVSPAGVSLDIERGGRLLTVSVTPETYCNSPVLLLNDPTINAFADGKAVYILGGMLRFTESDDELAAVIGHEIGHNAMLHIEKMTKNSLIGGLFGAIADVAAAAAGFDTDGAFTEEGMKAGRHMYSVAFEQEADYVGLYLARRAGYNLAAAPTLWRRMATVDPAQITYSGSHPTTAERFLALDQVVDEIYYKESQRLALVPDPVGDGETTTPTSMLASSAGAGSPSGAKGFAPTGGALQGAGGATAAAAAVANIAPAAGGDVTYGLLLGSYSSREMLEASWRLIEEDKIAEVGGLDVYIQKEMTEEERQFLLVAGPFFSPASAAAACTKLRDLRQYCSVARFEGEPLY